MKEQDKDWSYYLVNPIEEEEDEDEEKPRTIGKEVIDQYRRFFEK